MAPETDKCMSNHTRTCGVIGMLVIDRDAHFLPQVLQHLQAALETLCSNCISELSARDVDSKNNAVNDCEKWCQCGSLCDIDLIVSARETDSEARAAIQQYCPVRIRHLELLTANYDARFSNHYHSDAVLEAICDQRNAIRKYILQQAQYNWLFFLDSDILLQPSTLLLLLQTQRHCIGATYMPRWSRHVVVGINQANEDATECTLQLLLNPQLLRSNVDSIPCSILGFGATLVRSSLFHIPYRIQESIGGVKGEDIGFCMDLLALDHIDYQPYFLTGHCVVHLSGGASPSPFIPDLEHDYPLLTHIRVNQLYWVENNLSIEWQVQGHGRTVLSVVSHIEKQQESTTDKVCMAKSDLQTIPLENVQDPASIEQSQTNHTEEESEARFLRVFQHLAQARYSKRCSEPIMVERMDQSLTLANEQTNMVCSE